MNESLLNYLKRHSSLSQEESLNLAGLFHHKSIAKGNFWIRQNEECPDIAFLVSGIIRVFYEREEEEITLEFVFPESFITAFTCSDENNKSSWNLQALVDCEMLLIEKEVHRKWMSDKIHSIDFYEKQITRAFKNKEKKLLSLLELKADERFEKLFREQPDIFNSVPLKHIASSLGITPETLSRLRKKLVSRNS